MGVAEPAGTGSDIRYAGRNWLLTSGPNETRMAMWLLAAALLLRVGFVLLYPQFPFGLSDDRAYDELGWSLASGTGFSLVSESGRVPAIGIGPAYPFFLSLIYFVFGHDLTALRVVQAVFSAAMVPLIWQVARGTGYSRDISLLSAALVTIYPAFIIYSGVVLTEILFTLFLVASTCALLRALGSRSSWMWMLAGGLNGITILLRSEAIILVPMIAGVVLYRPARRAEVGRLLVFVAVGSLVVASWTIRNYITFHEIVPVAANGGRTLWISTKGWDEWVPTDPELQGLISGLDEVHIDRVLGGAAIQNIIEGPLQYLGRCLMRIPQFWVGSHTTYLVGFTDSFGAYLARGAYGRFVVKIALLAGNLAVLLFAVAGAWRIFRSTPGKPVALLLVPILGLAVVHVLLFATSRYQVPVMPFVLVFAAVQLAPCVSAGWGSLRSA